MNNFEQGHLFADRYTVLRQVHTDAMGVSYEVEDVESGARCVLKIVQADIGDSAVAREQLEREAFVD